MMPTNNEAIEPQAAAQEAPQMDQTAMTDVAGTGEAPNAAPAI